MNPLFFFIFSVNRYIVPLLFIDYSKTFFKFLKALLYNHIKYKPTIYS